MGESTSSDRPRMQGSCVEKTLKAAAAGVAAGTFYGSVTMAWYPDPVTSKGRFGGVLGRSDSRQVFRAIARPSLFMAVAGATFSAVECAAETIRGSQDSWNSMYGGMAAGALIGAKTKRADIMTSAAIALGLTMLMVDFTGPLDRPMNDEMKKKMYGVLPTKHSESDELRALKEKFPKFKDC